MRNAVIVTVACLCLSGAVFAQSQADSHKTFRDQIQFDTPVKVEGTVLKPGEYSIVATGTQVTFRRMVEDIDPGTWKLSTDKPIVVTAKIKDLPEKVPTTQVETPVDGSGTHFLEKIVMHDSDVELDFN